MDTKNHIHVLSRGVMIDQNHILLCRTLDLETNFYFLPGGHIEHNESAQNALIREFIEETGTECTIKRFLGCLEYSFEPGHNSICHNHEYNFIFEVESKKLNANHGVQQLEKHIELSWITLDSFHLIDLRPTPLQTLIPQWLAVSQINIFNSIMI